MNFREKLLLHTNLKSEQVHILEKVVEHFCFLESFYDRLKIVIPGREKDKAAVITTESDLSIASLEDPRLMEWLKTGFSEYPVQPAADMASYTPIFYGTGKLLALAIYCEKRGTAANLEELIGCCNSDLDPKYPINYLVPDGILVMDSGGVLLYANSVAQSICRRLSVSGDSFAAMIQALGISNQMFREFLSKPTFMCNYLQIEHFDISIILNPLFTGGQLAGALIVLSDLTLIKKKERELIKKSTVIKEIHHRVKNNLQTITSLLSLQMRRTNSEKVEKAFHESINRILSIAIIHEALSHQELEIINIKQTIYKILEMILANMVPPNKTINGEICGDDVYLNALQASNLSLCVTELIQNAVQHAFTSQTEGFIRVTVEAAGHDIQITVQDNGGGISSKGLENVRSLGMQIVETITQNNLNGRFFIKGSRAGTAAHIVFPASLKEGGD